MDYSQVDPNSAMYSPSAESSTDHARAAGDGGVAGDAAGDVAYVNVPQEVMKIRLKLEDKTKSAYLVVDALCALFGLCVVRSVRSLCFDILLHRHKRVSLISLPPVPPSPLILFLLS